MKKYYGLIIWGLLLALTLFLALIIPKTYTAQIWAVVVFDIIAFVSQFVIWFEKVKSQEKTFYRYPAMVISTIYLVLQLIISTVVAVVNDAISFKAVLIINFLLLVIMWVLILSSRMARDKIESLDSRQKNHHIEL
jgi:hypothetical protein